MSDIRKHFTSRFEEGAILELDFSQLEIFALAYLSGDKNLKADLLSGQDLHGISATMLFGPQYTKEQRKIAKQLSFQLQYGAGAKSMAARNGIPVPVAQKFIDNYYGRYSGVKKFHDKLLSEVEKGRATNGMTRTPKGLPAGISTIKSKTGRMYTFTEQDAPDWMREAKWGRAAKSTSFSPTQIKNYPVQGFATGDIVPMVIGKLFRELRSDRNFDGKVLLINTVHDSVVFDCCNEMHAIVWANKAMLIMQSAPEMLKELFPECADFDLPLNVEVEMGENWHDMIVLDKR